MSAKLTRRHINVLQKLAGTTNHLDSNMLPNGHGHCGGGHYASGHTLRDLNEAKLIAWGKCEGSSWQYGYRITDAGRAALAEAKP